MENKVSVEVEIDKVSFFTSQSGNVLPIVSFKENDELNKIGIDSLIFDNYESFLNKRPITIKSKLNLVLSKHQSFYELDSFTDLGSKEILYTTPILCTACDGTLYLKNGSLLCANKKCVSNSLAPIRIFIESISPSTDIDTIEAFLNGFPVIGEATTICNSYEFLNFFFGVRVKNTASRQQNWVDIHGEELGYKLWSLEKEIAFYLARKTIPKKLFWSILNLPLNIIELRQLYEIAPNKIQLSEKTPQRIIDVVNNAVTLIDIWLRIFNFYGDKEWS